MIQKRVIKMIRMLSLLLIAGILLLSGCGDETTTAPAEPGVIPIKLKTIVRPFKARLEIANANYKDKIFDVTGVVQSIGKDEPDTPYVILADKDEPWVGKFLFAAGDQAQVAKLKKGQKVTIRSNCDGFFEVGQVNFSQSSIVP